MTTIQLALLCTYGCAYTGCSHLLQEESLPTAESKGERWSDAEIAFIEGTQDESITEVARALNRTYYATAHARSKVKRGILRA